jgi:glycerol kinase
VVLAIDQGTSGTTCLVVDGELRVRGRGFRPVRQYYPRPGWVEHDPEDIWRSVVAATEQALVDARVRAGDVRAIGITNQRETTLLWDRRSGEPVQRAIVWERQALQLPPNFISPRSEMRRGIATLDGGDGL